MATVLQLLYQKISKYSACYVFFPCLHLLKPCFFILQWSLQGRFNDDWIYALQLVIMPRVSGLQIAGDHSILVSAVSSGYHQCGHVEWHNGQISHLRDTAGSQKVVICKSLTGPSSWQSRYNSFFLFDLVFSNTSQQDYFPVAIFIWFLSGNVLWSFLVWCCWLLEKNNTVPICFGTFISCK
jgi:hypothetical protein